MNRKGQTTMIVLVLVIVIFFGMITFLLSLAETVSQSEYLNLYTHQLLSAMLKADTGYLDTNCRTIADTLACAYFSPAYVCGGVQDCNSLAHDSVEESIAKFDVIKQGFRHYLTVEPEGLTVIVGGGIQSVEVGDLSLRDERTDKFIASERIVGIFGGESYILDVTLTVAEKD